MNGEPLLHLPVDGPAIRQRVLAAIAANREPGLHFIGHFLGFQWRKASAGIVNALFPEGPHCRTAGGEVDPLALGIFIDQSLAAAVRAAAGVPPGCRLGTVQLQAQFTGLRASGDLEADAFFLGRSDGLALRQSFARERISSQGRPLCHISGAYAQLPAPTGVTLGPMPWERAAAPPAPPLVPDQLAPGERALLAACEAALKKVSPEAAFIQRFWGLRLRRTAYGAGGRIPIGLQIANRVGHVHGGILFGLAAASAGAAAPAEMALSNLSVCFISPGRGTALTLRSRLLHGGRRTAVVHTEIRNAEGGRVLEGISNHAVRGGA
jgi:acyl-coenzyme A thioesterase PaaI-like protein